MLLFRTLLSIAALTFALVLSAFVASAQEQTCKVSGTVPELIKKYTCPMATAIHGNTKRRTLSLRVNREMAKEFRSESVDAEEFLLRVLDVWKNQKKNNRIGWVKVYYGRVHLATARTRAGKRDVVEFK